MVEPDAVRLLHKCNCGYIQTDNKKLIGITMKCPGQDTRYWKPDDIFEMTCGKCGYSVEFFKTDVSRSCPGCHTLIKNPNLNTGCAQWCSYAKECLGFNLQDEQIIHEDNFSLICRLLKAVKHKFGDDLKRINHTILVFNHALKILEQEGGNKRIVTAASLLHDIGIQKAERKYGSSVGKYQEIEGPPITRKILENTDLESSEIEHVCRIVGNHHSGNDIDTLEFKIVWDADWLVNIPDEYAHLSKKKLKTLIEKIFRTKTGKEKAYKLFFDTGTDIKL